MQRQINYNLESLRGYISLTVVFFHLNLPIFSGYLDNYKPGDLLLGYNFPGHLSVLIFFVLSGYVIGISNPNGLTKNGILPYLKKRFLRIYPIYFLVLLGTLLISTKHYSIPVLLSHFALTQGALSEIIYENGALWSINFEFFYYLLFVLVALTRINLLILMGCCSMVGLVPLLLYPAIDIPLISSYAFGFIFWLAGLFLARYKPDNNAIPSYSLALSCIFFFLSLEYYNILPTIINKCIGLVAGKSLEYSEQAYWVHTVIPVDDLGYLPYCLAFIVIFTGIDFKYKRFCFVVLQVLPVLTFVYIFNHWGNAANNKFLVAGIFYSISLGLFFIKSKLIEKVCGKIILSGFGLGSISYGIYIVHLPIIFLFNRVDLFSGSPFTFVLRFVLFLVLVLGISFLLEKKFQFFVKRKLM